MAINLSRIYTRGGDKGQTSLASGERVPKDHPRLEGYGTSDELCAIVGRFRTFLILPGVASPIRTLLEPQIANIQDRLFDLGTMIATPIGQEWPGMPSILESDISELEQWIDAMNAELEPLKSFVLPGGSLLNTEAHMARTVCRRLERIMCSLQAQGIEIPSLAMSYANRLSDYFFVVSRWVSKQEGIPEFVWSQRKGQG